MDAVREGVSEALNACDIRNEWLAGRYDSALALLAALPANAERELFRARILGRLGRHDEVRTTIDVARMAGHFMDPCSAAMAHSFEAVSYAAEGHESAARIALEHAGSYRDWGVTQQSVELAYNIAMTTWMLGDVAQTETIVREHVTGQRSHIDPLFTARFLSLRGWLFAAREQYLEQATTLTAAVELLLAAPQTDVGVLAWLVHALAALVRDINLPRAISVIADLEKRVAWTDSLRNAHFETLRALAWALALQGDYISAIRKLHRASDVAGGGVQRMISRLDEVVVAELSQQHVLAAALLQDTTEHIATEPWSSGRFEEAAALVYAAEVLAPSNAAYAASLLHKAHELRKQMSRNAGYAHDRRLDAMTDFADALVREAQGDRRVARHRAERAYEVFEACGYTWRAARCALLLHVITKRPEWLERSRELIAVYPRSFIAQEVDRRTEGTNPFDRLSARQRDVLHLLRSGKSTDEIGAALQISPNTVRIHLKRIYGTFGVKNRTALLAAAARLLAA